MKGGTQRATSRKKAQRLQNTRSGQYRPGKPLKEVYFHTSCFLFKTVLKRWLVKTRLHTEATNNQTNEQIAHHHTAAWLSEPCSLVYLYREQNVITPENSFSECISLREYWAKNITTHQHKLQPLSLNLFGTKRSFLPSFIHWSPPPSLTHIHACIILL